MPEFRARLGTPTGEIIERDYTAESVESLRRDLERQEYLVLKLQKRSAAVAAVTDLFRVRRSVNTKEFLVFNQELAALIRAGLPIAGSLEILLERRKNPVFREALKDVRDRVRAGESLSEAFNAQGVFPAIYGASLASGERSGEIATMLGRYIDYTKTVLGVRKRVVAALTYPAILLGLTVALVSVLVYFVLPKFREFFADFGADLPILTQALIGFSEAVRANVILILLALAGLVIGLLAYGRTRAGRLRIDGIKLNVPVLGGVSRRYGMSRFARTLSTLVAGGIPLVASLEIVTRAVGNTVFEKALLEVTQKVREGGALADALDETGLFNDMAIEMIKVGESTGALAEMLAQVADFLDDEIEQRLATIVTLVEPVMLIFMAALVATILLAIYYPLLQLYSQSRTG